MKNLELFTVFARYFNLTLQLKNIKQNIRFWQSA